LGNTHHEQTPSQHAQSTQKEARSPLDSAQYVRLYTTTILMDFREMTECMTNDGINDKGVPFCNPQLKEKLYTVREEAHPCQACLSTKEGE
jgi:hypothetical protein